MDEIAEQLNKTSAELPLRVDDNEKDDTGGQLGHISTIPPAGKALFVCLVLLTSLASVLGNICSVWLTVRIRSTVATSRFLVCLAVTDLLQTFTICASETANILHDLTWVYGAFLCKAIPFVQTASALANALTLSCIAIGRYLAITATLQWRALELGRVSTLALLFIWSFSVAICFPISFLFEYEASTDNKRGYCWWGSSDESFKRIYFFVVPLCMFLPLFLVITILYTYMARYLWLRKPPGVLQQDQVASQARRWRIVKYLALLIIVFLCCRGPVQVFNILQGIKKYNLTAPVLAFRYCLTLIKLLNCAINPLLYCLLHDRFKAYLVAMAKKLACGLRLQPIASFGHEQSSNALADLTNRTKKSSLPLDRLLPPLLNRSRQKGELSLGSWQPGQTQTLERLIANEHEPHSV